MVVAEHQAGLLRIITCSRHMFSLWLCYPMPALLGISGPTASQVSESALLSWDVDTDAVAVVMTTMQRYADPWIELG